MLDSLPPAVDVYIYSYSRSHSDAQLGNGVHFIWKPASRPKFDAENDGADRFLKNGAQNSIMATRKFNMAATVFLQT